MTPSHYPNDPYGELVNQIGHTFLGVAIAVITCGFWGFLFGEMPYRLSVIVSISLLYLVVELIQGWKAADSRFDWLMVVFGAVFPMVSLREVEQTPIWYKVSLEANFLSLFVFVLIWIVILATRIRKRL